MEQKIKIICSFIFVALLFISLLLFIVGAAFIILANDKYHPLFFLETTNSSQQIVAKCSPNLKYIITSNLNHQIKNLYVTNQKHKKYSIQIKGQPNQKMYAQLVQISNNPQILAFAKVFKEQPINSMNNNQILNQVYIYQKIFQQQQQISQIYQIKLMVKIILNKKSLFKKQNFQRMDHSYLLNHKNQFLFQNILFIKIKFSKQNILRILLTLIFLKIINIQLYGIIIKCIFKIFYYDGVSFKNDRYVFFNHYSNFSKIKFVGSQAQLIFIQGRGFRSYNASLIQKSNWNGSSLYFSYIQQCSKDASKYQKFNGQKIEEVYQIIEFSESQFNFFSYYYQNSQFHQRSEFSLTFENQNITNVLISDDGLKFQIETITNSNYSKFYVSFDIYNLFFCILVSQKISNKLKHYQITFLLIQKSFQLYKLIVSDKKIFPKILQKQINYYIINKLIKKLKQKKKQYKPKLH